MNARVIVTLKCNRNCENCCNKEEVFNEHEILTNINDLLSYDEIIITGGEPMLIPEKIIEFIKNLKNINYLGKIYMYSALYNLKLSHYYSRILMVIDGLQFTVHSEAKDQEIIELKQLSESEFLNRLSEFKSLRLAIDSRLYDKYDFSNIDFSNWSVVRKMQWRINVPLPQNEKLFIYEL